MIEKLKVKICLGEYMKGRTGYIYEILPYSCGNEPMAIVVIDRKLFEIEISKLEVIEDNE